MKIFFFANQVKNGETYSEKYISLTSNIDFSNPKSYVNPKTKEFGDINNNNVDEELLIELTTGEGFYGVGIEIDNDRENKSFKGYFNGNNYEINHLFINKENNSKISTYFSLFNVNFGTITGIKLKNVNIKGKGNTDVNCIVGGIAGNNLGTIQNCSCSGNIDIKSNVEDRDKVLLCGGITGNNNTNGKILNCFNLSNISVIRNTTLGMNYIGGLAGQCYNSKIENCYNISDIENESDVSLNVHKGSLCGFIYENVGLVNNLYFIKKNGINGVGTIENDKFIGNVIEETTEETLKKSYIKLGDAFLEDTNNINNGYPILKWQAENY